MIQTLLLPLPDGDSLPIIIRQEPPEAGPVIAGSVTCASCPVLVGKIAKHKTSLNNSEL